MTPLRFIRYAIVTLGFGAALWLLGLASFVTHIKSLEEPPLSAALPSTDAIVVLTGGSERMEAGVALLDAGKGKKLFISGVYPGLSLNHLLNNVAGGRHKHDDSVVLGHQAETTFGNATETKAWMTQEGYHSLRLVTSNYHMLRSLMIFRDAMPNREIVPYPVMPRQVRLDDWWRHPGTASLLVTEYNKYLGAMLRLRAETP